MATIQYLRATDENRSAIVSNARSVRSETLGIVRLVQAINLELAGIDALVAQINAPEERAATLKSAEELRQSVKSTLEMLAQTL